MSSVRARHAAAWRLCLAVAPAVIGLYYLLVHLGAWPAVQMALYSSASVAFAAGCLVTARRHPSTRLIMMFLTASAVARIAADVGFYVLTLRGSDAYPSLADFGYLASYPLMAVGLLLVIRRRTPGLDVTGAIDAAIGTGYLVHEFIIAPTYALTADTAVRLVSVAYPVGDLVLLVVGARLVLGGGPRNPALRLVTGYLTLLLCADTVYSYQAVNGTYEMANYLDAIWMAAAFLLAAAVLHPSAPQMISSAGATTQDATTRRVVLLAAAALLAPTSMLIQAATGGEPHVVAAGIACDVLFVLVLTRMAGLVRAQRSAAITDALTGLRSRRFFEQTLRQEAARSARHHQPLSVLLLDVDHFKRVNDTYGHGGGDRVLVEITHRVGDLLRPGDVLARYGGEEFAVLLPAAGEETARQVAERVRRGVAATPIEVGDGHAVRVTVSVGVAGMPAEPTIDALVLAADRALYAAKNAGRNQVSCAMAA
ncbi:GGDEF domain-containing protein [Actinoplanes sp. NPDC051851]|uniref:GGDEF domain-containing protein n=1 Tax=Actinoplanes sp. NPDC051851 TaxID=3154753 RepID=UPI0034231376